MLCQDSVAFSALETTWMVLFDLGVLFKYINFKKFAAKLIAYLEHKKPKWDETQNTRICTAIWQ